jgi:hypothetical protein
MTNKELYNIVFEKFVQAKKELIREGYRKTSLDEVDFNEVFNKTKHQLREAKIQSLMRENKMLKNKLKKEGLMDNISRTGNSEVGGFGSEKFGTGMDRVGAFFGHKGSKAELAASELENTKDNEGLSFFDKMMDIYPRTGKDGLISLFKIKMNTNLKSGMSKDEAKRKVMADMGGTLSENRRRRY